MDAFDQGAGGGDEVAGQGSGRPGEGEERGRDDAGLQGGAVQVLEEVLEPVADVLQGAGAGQGGQAGDDLLDGDVVQVGFDLHPPVPGEPRHLGAGDAAVDVDVDRDVGVHLLQLVLQPALGHLGQVRGHVDAVQGVLDARLQLLQLDGVGLRGDLDVFGEVGDLRLRLVDFPLDQVHVDADVRLEVVDAPLRLGEVLLGQDDLGVDVPGDVVEFLVDDCFGVVGQVDVGVDAGVHLVEVAGQAGDGVVVDADCRLDDGVGAIEALLESGEGGVVDAHLGADLDLEVVDLLGLLAEFGVEVADEPVEIGDDLGGEFADNALTGHGALLSAECGEGGVDGRFVVRGDGPGPRGWARGHLRWSDGDALARSRLRVQ